MDFKSVIKLSKRQKLILILILFVSFSSKAFCQSASNSISFTKKEIAFFKWGDGANEIGMSWEDNTEQVKKMDYKVSKKTGEVVSMSITPTIGPILPRTELHIDGNGSIYFSDSVHKRIFVLSPDGEKERTIEAGNDSNFRVDEVGDVFFYDYKVGEPQGLTCVKLDDRKFFYKNIKLSYIESGVAYDANKEISITDNGNKPQKPLLFGTVEKSEGDGNYIIYIHSRKFWNDHVVTGRPFDDKSDNGYKEIPVKIEKKHKLEYTAEVLGIDGANDVYVLGSYRSGLPAHFNYFDFNVDIYSLNGDRLVASSFRV